jgi:hypothetical protein
LELKPSQDKQSPRKKVKLDGVGNRLSEEAEKNPFYTIGRGMESRGTRRRRPMADTLGATPPRDGPFAMGAADIAVQKPPKGRQRRTKSAGTTWLRKR